MVVVKSVRKGVSVGCQLPDLTFFRVRNKVRPLPTVKSILNVDGHTRIGIRKRRVGQTGKHFTFIYTSKNPPNFTSITDILETRDSSRVTKKRSRDKTSPISVINNVIIIT